MNMRKMKAKMKREKMKAMREILDSLIVGLDLTTDFKFKYTEYHSTHWIFEKTNQLGPDRLSFAGIDLKTFRIDIYYMSDDKLYLSFKLDNKWWNYFAGINLNCEGLLKYKSNISKLKGEAIIELNNQEDIPDLIMTLIKESSIGAD